MLDTDTVAGDLLSEKSAHSGSSTREQIVANQQTFIFVNICTYSSIGLSADIPEGQDPSHSYELLIALISSAFFSVQSTESK
jgi:hypothetical protein